MNKNPIYKCVRCGENKDDNKSRYTFDNDLKGKICFECKEKEHEVRDKIDKAKNRFNRLLIDVFINKKHNEDVEEEIRFFCDDKLGVDM